MSSEIINSDCLPALKKYPNDYFSASSFSPPYDVGNTNCFDIRKDFQGYGRFIEYAKEINRVSKLWGINITQKVIAKKNSTYIEHFILTLEELGIELFDRWIIYKPFSMPKRGNRALTSYEFVLLFTKDSSSIIKHRDGNTVIKVNRHHPLFVDGDKTDMPYFEEIPRQIFSMYGFGIVLDPFCGTGTSLIEAKKLGLEYVGIELDPKIYEICKKRVGYI